MKPNENQQHYIEKKVHEIARVLFQAIAQKRLEDVTHIGMYSGKGGIILFLSHYLNRYLNPSYQGVYEEYLDCFFEELTDIPQLSLSYCSGLVGAFETLRILNESSLIELDFGNIEAAYNERILLWLDQCFFNQNYDFLHGALGVSMYFRNNEQYVENTLRWLKKNAIKDGDKFKWTSILGQDRSIGYNICLSHGMSSIIAYLSDVYKSGVMPELSQQLLEGSVKYVLSQEIDHTIWGCYFPSQSLENNDSALTKSRLAWCYGDLGVAAALWQAGRVTKNISLQNKALDVYRFSAQRRNIQDEAVRDAELCHGTAGIAMMFAYMYKETSDVMLKATCDYWITQTLDMSRFPDGLAGYKQLKLNDNKQLQWSDNYTLLEGISGIGLMLLSVLSHNVPKNLFTSFALY